MTETTAGAFVDLSTKAADIEKRLADALRETSDQLAHADTLDSEQRAELYTILQTLMTDGQQHQEWLGQWVGAEKAHA